MAIKVRKKLLIPEDSSLADRLSGALRDNVNKLIVCGPRHNALISRSSSKDDREDAYILCRLLRLDELNSVFHSDQWHRETFKNSVQRYLELREHQVAQKNCIKATFHHAGVLHSHGKRIFDAKHREHYLSKLPDTTRRDTLSLLYAVLDSIRSDQEAARAGMIRLHAKYIEIKEFMRMPGIGLIGAMLSMPSSWRRTGSRPSGSSGNTASWSSQTAARQASRGSTNDCTRRAR